MTSKGDFPYFEKILDYIGQNQAKLKKFRARTCTSVKYFLNLQNNVVYFFV